MPWANALELAARAERPRSFAIARRSPDPHPDRMAAAGLVAMMGPYMDLSARRPVVLAVLDDSERSALLKLSLVGRGWDVVRAHSCEQARTRVLEQPIDALLTDLVLGDGSAFGVLRSMPVQPRVTVVLTWGNQHGIRERIACSGFDLHLVRPISAEEIDRAMRDKLESLERTGRLPGMGSHAPQRSHG